MHVRLQIVMFSGTHTVFAVYTFLDYKSLRKNSVRYKLVQLQTVLQKVGYKLYSLFE